MNLPQNEPFAPIRKASVCHRKGVRAQTRAATARKMKEPCRPPRSEGCLDVGVRPIQEVGLASAQRTWRPLFSMSVPGREASWGSSGVVCRGEFSSSVMGQF